MQRVPYLAADLVAKANAVIVSSNFKRALAVARGLPEFRAERRRGRLTGQRTDHLAKNAATRRSATGSDSNAGLTRYRQHQQPADRPECLM
jgi:hypothetical protein